MTNNDDFSNYIGGKELENNNDDDDDDEEERPMDTFLILGKKNVFSPPFSANTPLFLLIIGKSKTGKSNLVRNLLQQYQEFDKVVYMLNDRSKNCPYTKIQWHQLQEISNCALVVEDVMTATNKQYR